MSEDLKKWVEIAKVVVGAFVAIAAIFAGSQVKQGNEIAQQHIQVTEKQTQVMQASPVFGGMPSTNRPSVVIPAPVAPR